MKKSKDWGGGIFPVWLMTTSYTIPNVDFDFGPIPTKEGTTSKKEEETIRREGGRESNKNRKNNNRPQFQQREVCTDDGRDLFTIGSINKRGMSSLFLPWISLTAHIPTCIDIWIDGYETKTLSE